MIMSEESEDKTPCDKQNDVVPLEWETDLLAIAALLVFWEEDLVPRGRHGLWVDETTSLSEETNRIARLAWLPPFTGETKTLNPATETIKLDLPKCIPLPQGSLTKP